MALDPQIEPIVDAVNRAAASAPPEPTTEERRQGYLALSQFAGAGPELDEVTDTSIPGPAGDIAVRIYRNEGARGLFVFYHGGGYCIGDLDTHDEVCRQLASQAACTVMAVDYRLAPEHPFPAGVEDAWAALQYADSHRDELGGSGSRIVVGGDSAGGSLAAVVSLMARDAGIGLAAQLLVYPGTRLDDDSPSLHANGTGYVLEAKTMEWFFESYAADPTDWRASPIYADSHEGLAPALVITAEYDPIRDQGRDYAQTLRDPGVEVTHTDYSGMVHVFFQLGPLVDKGAQAVSEVARFARKALG
jgi:acetyl esterase